MDLTRSNYHSKDANKEFMSRSQYLGFLECEAGQLASIEGRWEDEPSVELLVGSYVHSWNEGTQEQFIPEHPEMFTKAGELKAPFRQAEKMIAALADDPLCIYTLEGQKEVIFTAEFAGAIWKVMLDAYRPECRRITDLKTTKSITELSWSIKHSCKLNFIEMYDYPVQAALYSEIERRAKGRPEHDWMDFYMVAVSKEKVPDKAIIEMSDPERYLIELAQIEENMPRILAVKSGRVEPTRCECCDYCRSTKKLTGAVYYKAI